MLLAALPALIQGRVGVCILATSWFTAVLVLGAVERVRFQLSVQASLEADVTSAD